MNPIELRISDDSDGKLTLEGYASRTGVPYEVGSFTETVSKGAFRRGLNASPGPNVMLLVNHEGLPLARTTSGNLHLSEDEHGLHVRAEREREDPDVKPSSTRCAGAT